MSVCARRPALCEERNGRDPGRKELLAVGIAAGMKKGSCEKIIDEIQTYVKQMLREYLERCQ